MKTFIITLLIVFLFFPVFSQDLPTAEVYRLHYTKYKFGTKNKALKIGKTLFSGALNEAGTGHIALVNQTGPWDVVVIIPMDPNNPHRNLNQDKFSQKMKEIAGTDEALMIMMDEYNSYVLDEAMYYYKGVTNYPLDNAEFYRSRHIKCTAGNTSEAIKGGMKHLNGALEQLGTKNLVLQSISGPDDIIIIEPMVKDNIFTNSPNYSKKWSAALANTGTAEERQAFFKRWAEIVQREELHYFTKL